MEHDLLHNILIYLTAAVIAVPIFRKVGFGSILGYLVAGAIIGPWGLALINDYQDILHFSEFGVVLLLFLIGLELEPKRLWNMRHSILGLGGGQLFITAILFFTLGIVLGLNLTTAIIIALILSMSSTAIALQALSERNLLSTKTGKSVFSVLLFQDLAVIPLMALIPLFGSGAQSTDGNLLLNIIEMIGVVSLVIIVGHFITEPIFRMIAYLRMREIFVAFSLLLIIGIALLMEKIGLSMALGSFLAGMLLAESEFRHELESEIEPFKGLLMGLFFIAIGMSINFGLLAEKTLILITLLVALLLIKLGALLILAKLSHFTANQASQFAIVLSQGGEFAFVLLAISGQFGVMDKDLIELLIVLVALSMASTPLLLLLNDHLIVPRLINRKAVQQTNNDAQDDEIETPIQPVIIIGFGRFGRIIGRMLHANRILTTVLDNEPEQIEYARRYGYKLFFGNVLKPSLLRSAGADKAQMLIVCVENTQLNLEIVDMVKKHFPNIQILSRAHDLAHAFELLDRDVNEFRREVLESAFSLGERAMVMLGYGAYDAHQLRNKFSQHDNQLMYQLYDTDVLENRISLSRMAREEFAKTLELDEKNVKKGIHQEWEK